MLEHYQKLARLLAREEQVLGDVADFYIWLDESLKVGQLPPLSELFAGGAQVCDDLQKVTSEKRELLEEFKVESLRQLLATKYPNKIRRLVGLKGAAIMELRRKISARVVSITQSLEVLQVVNQRFCDFFQQLVPSTINYQAKGAMVDRGTLYSGVSLNSTI